MFMQLFSIEWTRLTRRALPWFAFAACGAFICLSLQHYYTQNRTRLFDGSLTMPGASFDLANSLDQLLLIALPFIIFIAAVMLGSDYSQRTNQHWLMRGSRTESLLAKFLVIALAILCLQFLVLVVGGLTGWYYKTFLFDAYSLANVNWSAAFAAALYMTLATLPYAAFVLLVTVVTRSSFAGIAIGLGYTQFFELLLSGAFYRADWSKWMMRNLHFSVTHLLNSIGNKTVDIPSYRLDPVPALIALTVYTLIFLSLAAWFYRRQDVGG